MKLTSVLFHSEEVEAGKKNDRSDLCLRVLFKLNKMKWYVNTTGMLVRVHQVPAHTEDQLVIDMATVSLCR